jgi:hypothetical protein
MIVDSPGEVTTRVEGTPKTATTERQYALRESYDSKKPTFENPYSKMHETKALNFSTTFVFVSVQSTPTTHELILDNLCMSSWRAHHLE